MSGRRPRCGSKSNFFGGARIAFREIRNFLSVQNYDLCAVHPA